MDPDIVMLAMLQICEATEDPQKRRAALKAFLKQMRQQPNAGLSIEPEIVPVPGRRWKIRRSR